MRRRGVIKISSDAFGDFDEEQKKEEVVVFEPEPEPEPEPKPKPEEEGFDAEEACLCFEVIPMVECRNCGARKTLEGKIDYDSFSVLIRKQNKRVPIVDALTMECTCFFRFN